MSDVTNLEAPPEFVELTAAVRDVLLTQGSGQVYGTCIESSLILGWMLKQRGHPAEMWSCSPSGWPHWCIRSGEWILDPAAGQFGDVNPPLVFREGSPEHWYAPGHEETFAITEEEITFTFEDWIAEDAQPTPVDTLAGRSRAIPALLDLAGLRALEIAIQKAGAARAADPDRETEIELAIQDLMDAAWPEASG